MTPVRIASIVEGHGEVVALPELLRRIAKETGRQIALEILKPIRRPRSSILLKSGELERAVQLAALQARPRGGIFVILDSDDDCPAKLAPELLARAERAAMNLPIAVVLAKREFEAWFLAAAESLRGKRGLPLDLVGPEHPEEVRGAKEWLRGRRQPKTYSPTIDQPALVQAFSLNQARSARSFDKCYREFERILDCYRD